MTTPTPAAIHGGTALATSVLHDDRRRATPNAVGIGGQVLANDVTEPVLRQLCVEIDDDGAAEIQAESGAPDLPTRRGTCSGRRARA